MRRHFSVLLTVVFLLLGCPLPTEDEEVTSPRDDELHENYPANKKAMVVGYLPIYRENTIDILKKTDLNKLTHVVLAFFNPDDWGNIAFDTSEQNLCPLPEVF